MAAQGGSVESCSIMGRNFAVAGDADVSLQLGGFTKETKPNGDGSARPIFSRVPWMAEGLQVVIDHDSDALSFLQARANEAKYVDVTITFVGNVTFMGRGSVEGDVKYSSQNATATITLAGPGEATKQ